MIAGTTSASPPHKNLPLCLNVRAPAQSNEGMEAGPQPLDAIMTGLQLKSHDLVRISGEHLTHKEVQKGRRGRRLTANLQGKLARALTLVSGRAYTPEELFTYSGR